MSCSTSSTRRDPARDVDAPPRLLPMWDGLLLGHADRSRVIDPEDRSRIVAGNGDTYPTFLVDGRVAGLWWTRRASGGPEIELEPFRPLRPADRAALEAEGSRAGALPRPSRARRLRHVSRAPRSDALHDRARLPGDRDL